MAVKVTRTLIKRSTDSDGQPVVEEYAEGDFIQNTEGHLHVYGQTTHGGRSVRAIFAPGEWKWAEVTTTK